MIWAASSTRVSGLADCGSAVIHADTGDTVRSSPEAAARRTSRSVRIPTRNGPCMTTAEPTFALTMPVAAVATDASRVVVTTRESIRSRSAVTATGSRSRGASIPPPYLIQLGVAVGTGRPGELLGEHQPQCACPCGQAGPLLPEHLESCLIELRMSPLCADGVPDVLKTVNQVEELAGQLI